MSGKQIAIVVGGVAVAAMLAVLDMQYGLDSTPATSRRASALAVSPSELEVRFDEPGIRERVESLMVRNIGKEMLVASGVATTCGCALAEGFEPIVLGPGKATELNVRFQSPGYDDRQVRVDVTSADPDGQTESVRVTLRAPKLKTPSIRKFPRETVVAQAYRRDNEAVARFVVRSV